jgi:cell division septum initiation protein DivIVA
MADLNPQGIRDVKLPVGLRGFDQAATREHLERAAAAHETLLNEVQQLRAALASAPPASSDEEQVAAMTDTLLAAKRTADELVRDAEKKAAALMAATELERSEILGRATAETTDRLAGVDDEIKRLLRERDEVRTTIAEERAAFTETLQRALRELDRSPTGEDTTLAATLRSRLTPDT